MDWESLLHTKHSEVLEALRGMERRIMAQVDDLKAVVVSLKGTVVELEAEVTTVSAEVADIIARLKAAPGAVDISQEIADLTSAQTRLQAASEVLKSIPAAP